MNLGMRGTRKCALSELVGWGSWMWVNRSWASYMIGLRAYLTFGGKKHWAAGSHGTGPDCPGLVAAEALDHCSTVL